MIEFPTDAKFSNMQVVPKSDKALFIKDAPFLNKTSDGLNWEIPDTFLPKDYVRISVSGSLEPESFDLGSNLPHTVYDTTTKTYFLNVGGVYRLTTNIDSSVSSSSIITNFSGFTNDINGHEVVESINQDGNYVYTIAPRGDTRTISVSIGESTINFQICNAFVKPTNDNGTEVKIIGLQGSDTIISSGTDTVVSGNIVTGLSPADTVRVADGEGNQISQKYTVP